MENIADYYYNILGETSKPGVELAKMYGAIFEINLERKHYIMFNKLVKTYGRFNVFFAILTVFEMGDIVDHNKTLYPLFSGIIKKRYESRTDMANVESMNNGTKIINSMERKIKELLENPIVIPDGEEDNE